MMGVLSQDPEMVDYKNLMSTSASYEQRLEIKKLVLWYVRKLFVIVMISTRWFPNVWLS